MLSLHLPNSGLDLTFPTVELSVPTVPPVGYQGNAGIRETSQVRGRKPTSGQGTRIPHAAAAVVGRGTPSVPPVDAVGVYALDRTGVPIIPVSQEPLAQRQETGGSTPDRSRSRDPPRENTPVVPIASQQVTMTVPDYMLPLMASAG